jgi:hypothetical protein
MNMQKQAGEEADRTSSRPTSWIGRSTIAGLVAGALVGWTCGITRIAESGYKTGAGTHAIVLGSVGAMWGLQVGLVLGLFATIAKWIVYWCLPNDERSAAPPAQGG